MRPIDADALLEKTIALARSFESNEDMLFYGKNKYIFKGVAYANHYISEAPTIDAVPVVRCGECKWFDKTGYEDDNANEGDSTLHMGYCRVWSRNTQACCFCSHGERRKHD